MPEFHHLKKKAQGGASKTAVRQPLSPNDFTVPGTVLAFDQSLGSVGSGGTGAVLLTWSGRHMACELVWFFRGLDTGTVKGHEMSLLRGLDMYQKYCALLGDLSQCDFDVAYETPPAGGRMARPESSLLAALAVLIAARSHNVQSPTMVSAQKGKKLVCGNPNAKKSEVHKVLKDEVFPWVEGSGEITNEAHRDALIVGLTYLWGRGR